MALRSNYIFLIGLVVVTMCSTIFAASNPESRKLLDRVLAERMAIKSGIVKATLKRQMENKKSSVKQYTWYFNGDSLRTDVKQSLIHNWSDGRSSEPESTMRIVFRDDQTLLWDDVRTSDNKNVAAYRVDNNHKFGREFLNGVLAYKVDPRLIGMIPRDPSSFYRFAANYFLTPETDAEITRSQDMIDGAKVEKLGFIKRETSITLWIDETRSSSVRAAATVSGTGSEITRNSIDVKLKQYGEFWYPQLVAYEKKKGDKVLDGCIIEVESAKFNVELPDDTFTLAGMGIPVGNMVVEIPSASGQTRFWDGKEVKGYEKVDHPKQLTPAMFGERFFWIGVSLLIIGVLVMLIVMKRRATIRSD